MPFGLEYCTTSQTQLITGIMEGWAVITVGGKSLAVGFCITS